MKIYYFGCWEGWGHFLWGPNRHGYPLSELDKIPWGYAIDSKLAPEGPETQGAAKLHHKDGWTCLSFWDRTVDPRGKSNSAFIVDDIVFFDQMIQISNEAFPEIWQRIGEVHLVP